MSARHVPLDPASRIALDASELAPHERFDARSAHASDDRAGPTVVPPQQVAGERFWDPEGGATTIRPCPRPSSVQALW